MITIIAGSRSISDPIHIDRAVVASGFKVTKVMSGRAIGVDQLGEQWAQDRNIPIIPRPANWYPNGVFNINAGYERNHEMGDEADALIAVWDGKSGGTEDMIKYMKKIGKPYYVYDINLTNNRLTDFLA